MSQVAPVRYVCYICTYVWQINTYVCQIVGVVVEVVGIAHHDYESCDPANDYAATASPRKRACVKLDVKRS